MPDNLNIAISIVLYNTPRYHLERCLRSIQLNIPKACLVVLDNSKSAQWNELVLGYFPKADYIHLGDNPGYGSAHNHAIRRSIKSGYDYHLVVNADVWFEENVLCPIVSFMELNPSVGVVMPKVLFPDGRIQYLCKLVPSPIDLLLRRFPLFWRTSRRFQKFEMRDTGYDKIMFVPYLSGCFLLFRCSVFSRAGLFDERFFLYPEDIDITRRFAEHSETIYYPLVSIYHEHQAGSYKSFYLFIIHVINIARYFNKWGWFKDPLRDSLNFRAEKQFG